MNKEDKLSKLIIEALAKCYTTMTYLLIMVILVIFAGYAIKEKAIGNIAMYGIFKVAIPITVMLILLYGGNAIVKKTKLSWNNKKLVSATQNFLIITALIIAFPEYPSMISAIIPTTLVATYLKRKSLVTLNLIELITLLIIHFWQLAFFNIPVEAGPIDAFVVTIIFVIVYYITLKLIDMENIESQIAREMYSRLEEEIFELKYDKESGMYNSGVFRSEISKKIKLAKEDFSYKLDLVLMQIDKYSEMKQYISDIAMKEIVKEFTDSILEFKMDGVIPIKYPDAKCALILSDKSDEKIERLLSAIAKSLKEKKGANKYDYDVTFSAVSATYKSTLTGDELFDKARRILQKSQEKDRDKIMIVGSKDKI